MTLDRGLIKAYIIHEDVIDVFDHDHAGDGEYCKRNGRKITCNGSRDRTVIRDVYERGTGEKVTDIQTLSRIAAVENSVTERKSDATT